MQKLLVKFKNEPCQDFVKVQNKSDWIDIKISESYVLKKGQHQIIELGFAMKLPDGYEAHLAPRSSTFKNTGLLLTNSIGIIDNSYCGDEDYWKASVYATRDCTINKGDRLFQFRLMKKMEDIEIEQVDKLDEKNRGGFGSTGLQ